MDDATNQGNTHTSTRRTVPEGRARGSTRNMRAIVRKGIAAELKKSGVSRNELAKAIGDRISRAGVYDFFKSDYVGLPDVLMEVLGLAVVPVLMLDMSQRAELKKAGFIVTRERKNGLLK